MWTWDRTTRDLSTSTMAGLTSWSLDNRYLLKYGDTNYLVHRITWSGGNGEAQLGAVNLLNVET